MLSLMKLKSGPCYVIVQVILIGSVLLSPFFEPKNTEKEAIFKIAGAILTVVGIATLILSFRFLGNSTTPNPAPKEGGPLVTTGVYRWIRHPMYTSLIFISYGWAFIF